MNNSFEMNRRTFLKRTASGAALAFPAIIGFAKSQPVLRAGVSKRCVTPPLFVPYLTSSAKGTNAPFQGIHDDLFARALVLDDDRQSLAILAVDSIGFDNSILGNGRNFTQEWRRKIAQRTGMKPSNLMLAATHTHAAPETIGLTSIRQLPGVAEWLEAYLQALVDAVVDAWKQRIPVRAFYGTQSVPGIERYRRIALKSGKLSVYGAVPPPEQVQTPWQLDETLSAISFERAGGGLHAALLNYTAHPVISMLLPQVSADYPGAATALVEKQFPNSVCLFTNGAAGNINTVKVSTNFEDVSAIGQKLGRAAVGTIQESLAGQPFRQVETKVRANRIELPPRPCPTVAEAEKIAPRTALNADGTVTRLALKLADGTPRGELQVMRLGPLRWISIPGEPFVETGLALKKAGANFVVGYANGYLGYFPIRRAYAEGGYEVMQGPWSRVAPGSAELLETQAKHLLGRV